MDERRSDRSTSASTRRGRLLLAAVVLGALALHLPSVGMGFYADDHVHQYALSEPDLDLPMRPWSLYDFGSREDWDAVGRGAAFPWWTSQDWTIRFFRPLTSLSLWLDHALFGDWAVGYHLTGLAWYAVLLVLVHALYRALGLSRGTAMLAVALLALCDSTVLAVGWPANRNALLAAVFTVAAVWALEQRERWGAGPALGAALLGAALAAATKESGVMAFVLIAARLATNGRVGEARRRWTAPGIGLALGLAVLYVVGLALAGFGTQSLFYATPWRDVGRFLGRLGVLLSAGTLSLAGPVPVDLAGFRTDLAFPLAVGCAAVLAPLAVWMARTLRGRPGVGFLALWIPLSIAPEAGAPPSDRVLLGAAVGGAALVASFVAAQRERRDRGPLARAGTWAVLLSATLGSGAYLVLQVVGNVTLAAQLRETALTAEVGDPALGPREAYVLQAENGFSAFALASTYGGETGDAGVVFVPLQIGRRGVRWTRIGVDAFELESLDEPFLDGLFERLYLTAEPPPAVGTTWTTPLVTVEAAAVDADGLRRIRVRLTGPLDDPRRRFLVAAEGGRLVAIPPPAVGESIEIPAAVPRNPLIP